MAVDWRRLTDALRCFSDGPWSSTVPRDIRYQLSRSVPAGLVGDAYAWAGRSGVAHLRPAGIVCDRSGDVFNRWEKEHLCRRLGVDDVCSYSWARWTGTVRSARLYGCDAADGRGRGTDTRCRASCDVVGSSVWSV